MRVFVYGTLTEPARVREVLDSFVFVGSATLEGLHAVDGDYPTLAPGGAVAGRLLRTDEIDALDAYERVADGLYVRVSVPLVADGTDDTPLEADNPTDDGTADTPATDPDSPTDTSTADSPTDDAMADTETSVALYVGDPDRLDAPADWPGDGPFPERVRRYLREHAVRVRRH